MNNFIARKLALGADYQPIAGSRLVASGTHSAPVTNAAVAYVRGDDGSDRLGAVDPGPRISCRRRREWRAESDPHQCVTFSQPKRV